MDKFGALLHKEWVKKNSTTIEGFWAEDYNSFEITCPNQLIDLILELQNGLSKVYTKVNTLYSEANRLKYNFERLL